MSKLYFYLMLLMMSCLSPLFLAAQTNPVNGNKPVDTIPGKRAFKLVFEKAYLHTDRDIYAPGDTLWFKAYLVNAQDNTPIGSSGNLHVDLIAPGKGIISSELIRLNNGLGNGDFSLPDSLVSGQYQLRAYTNWMRNFGDNFIFDKEIIILNTEAVQASVNPSAKNVNPKNQQQVPLSNAVTAPSPIVRFYPEGGSLVVGISSLVAVKAEDATGRGIMIKGAILTASGDTVARYACDSLGMGLFALLPIKGQVYHGIVTTARGLTFDLPVPLSKGLSLQVKQTDSLIRAVITNTDSAIPLACKLTVKHGGITLLSQQLQINGPQTAARIPSTGLPEGIAAITLYNEQNKPTCERLVYIHHTNTFNTIVITDKKMYGPKEKVIVKIDTKSAANLSVAVVDADMAPDQANDMISFLMLGSELRGEVEQAHHYFDTTNINRFKQLDLLLMTQGWRDFVWRRLADTAIRISYAAENGIDIPGRVRDEVSNKYMPGLNVSLYAPGAKGEKLYSALTDASGRFNFTGLMLYGNQTVKLTSVNGKGENKGSFMIDTLIPMSVKLNKAPTITAANMADPVTAGKFEKRAMAIKSAGIKGVTKLSEVKVRAKQNVILRGGAVLSPWGPDQVFDIKPEDEKFKTLEWYLLQHVKGALQSTDITNITGIVLRGIDTVKYIIHKLDGDMITYHNKNVLIPPQIFVNGRELVMDEPTQAESYRFTYYNTPIKKFKKVILKHMAGSLHGLDANGRTLNPAAERIIVDRYLLYLTVDEDGIIENPGAKSLAVPGYYETRAFYQPLPGAKPSLADYRSTIYWQPDLTTDAAGKATVSFYNSAAASKVKVIVQGIGTNGVPVSNVVSYNVK